MRFLRQLFLPLANWLRAFRQPVEDRPSSPSIPTTGELDAMQVVSRFMYTKKHMSGEHGRPKRQAFDPGKYEEVSVVHSSELLDRQIWELGQQTIGTQQGRSKIYGRADIPVKCLKTRKLKAIRDNKPFPRHSCVVGWPRDNDPDQQKQKRLEICLELAKTRRSSCHTRQRRRNMLRVDGCSGICSGYWTRCAYTG